MAQRELTQRTITLALAVLDRAAYGSGSKVIDTFEARLALAVLWGVLRERRWLLEYWRMATTVSVHPWEGCHQA